MEELVTLLAAGSVVVLGEVIPIGLVELSLCGLLLHFVGRSLTGLGMGL